MNKTKTLLAALCLSAVSAQACDTHFWLVRWAKHHHENIADEALFLQSHPKIAARLDRKCENARKHKGKRHHENLTPTPTPNPTGTPNPTPSPSPTPSSTPTPSPTPTPTPAGCVMGPLCWLGTDWCIFEMPLGNRVYNEAELRSILAEPVNPTNGLVNLARELISTKLGLACNSNPICIIETVNQADFVIGDLVVPPVGNGFLPLSAVSNLVQMLHAYSQGERCAPLCQE